MTQNKTISNAYAQIAKMSWAEILDAQRFYDYPTPLTVHLPLQPHHSRDLIHLDAALKVCRRRVIKGHKQGELLKDPVPVTRSRKATHGGKKASAR